MYLKSIMSSPIIEKQVLSQNSGSAMNFFGIGDTSKFKLPIPPLPEQQKIASFLTAVDTKIQQLTQKQALLTDYKKGVMQQLFSQQLRFQDENGQEFPAWEETQLSQLMSIPKKMQPAEIDSNKLLTVKLHLKGVLKNNNTESLTLGATNYFVRKKGQFIFGKQNLFNGAFSIIPDEFDGFLSSGDIPVLDINPGKMNPSFFLFYLSRESYYKKLESIASGSGSKRIHESTFLGILIDLPSLPEQTKIASFLTAIDDKIALVTKQLHHAQQFKKGLLQQLFV
ncbi:hypothetical protein BEN48_08275 [Hymenobacter glacialis]|uniref:Type I restriction modification DNA specificity domain-containing protein n=1 Tax=Hymenobacter glacialis TaxID=1908236 RepID=A0A1G1TDH0_9BACT|nr:hypothetical protein BEN48_08275 [Hymenobacter glacialis]